MFKARSSPRVGSWLGLLILFALPCAVRGAPPAATAAPAAEAMATPPLVVGVAIDETGITLRDLERSHDLILALLGSLPPGSLMTMASFSGDKRIVLPPTADPSQVTSALARFKPSQTGVALPDGLFDIVEYLSRQEAQARVLVLVSSGRVREGDLQFEDPLTAAAAKGIPIFALALGQGDGRLLRRVAKITGGEYMRLEVADASMLARAIGPRAGSTTNAANAATAGEEAAAGPTPSPPSKGSAGLLGAAAILFSLGGLLMLVIVVLLGRRLFAPARPPAPLASLARETVDTSGPGAADAGQPRPHRGRRRRPRKDARGRRASHSASPVRSGCGEELPAVALGYDLHRPVASKRHPRSRGCRFRPALPNRPRRRLVRPARSRRNQRDLGERNQVRARGPSAR